MTENEGYLVTSRGLFKGLYKDEVVMKQGRLWVWFKHENGKEWALQCPNQIVVDTD
ncbi:hypothetical protein SEA_STARPLATINUM_165 [Streptomyces phage StarPlatinum]|uniref:Uncharacterized protein n=1 Tax=Streptomyces phage StarPlatinum TaxID=2283265 RepID=A0A345M8S1_9CAUD|nr:hypothetical protein HWB77_gp145 [Streptomyces phage StarPlatinum]AXH66892.1 hypothetical protein SEA_STARPLATINUM_165 [Streptomyces phage StarPlatinum]